MWITLTLVDNQNDNYRKMIKVESIVHAEEYKGDTFIILKESVEEHVFENKHELAEIAIDELTKQLNLLEKETSEWGQHQNN